MTAWLVRRFRWVLIGWGVRMIARLGFRRSVDHASTRIESSLPAPVASAARRLPGDVVRVGGAALVVSESSAKATSQARKVVVGTRRLAGGPRTVTDRVRSVAGDISAETESSRRRLKSEMLRIREGEGAALDALLDLRDVEAEPIPDVPAPVPGGRRRFRPTLGPAPVSRVQRTYRRAVKPWDRPLR